MKYILTFEYETDELEEPTEKSLYDVMWEHLQNTKISKFPMDLINVEESDL
jgi:hypothetical protein